MQDSSSWSAHFFLDVLEQITLNWTDIKLRPPSFLNFMSQFSFYFFRFHSFVNLKMIVMMDSAVWKVFVTENANHILRKEINATR